MGKVGVLPSSYLGLPLGAQHNSMVVTVVWDAIEERFRKSLTLWKRLACGKGITFLKGGDLSGFCFLAFS